MLKFVSSLLRLAVFTMMLEKRKRLKKVVQVNFFFNLPLVILISPFFTLASQDNRSIFRNDKLVFILA